MTAILLTRLTAQVYFSPYFENSGYSDKECYALLHGYHWALTGNPATTWVDHQGVHLNNWWGRQVHGVWRASCAHLEENTPMRRRCRGGGWEFFFWGSWRAFALGTGVNFKKFFGISQDFIWGTNGDWDS